MITRRIIGLLLVTISTSPAAVVFERDVRPLLSDRCFTCHGPDDSQRKTAFRLDTEKGAQIELASGGRAIVPGKPDQSALLARVESDNEALRMPPAYLGYDRLTDEQIETLRRWIAEGAEWKTHWSFEPPRRPAVPEVDADLGPRNAIDRFVFDRLTREGLRPSPAAPRSTLIRRLSLDLTGLPPTPREVDDFLADDAPGAYERLVDRLLGSPRFGERMAVPWLDAARYADTNGYQTDGPREMWRWRDWVIDAFNRNMPFDQFTIEQLAGDLLPEPTTDQLIATAFHRNHRTTAEGGVVEEEFLVEYAADRAETTGKVWLGLTVGCARCHDHKYDPISQKDFYRLFAYFNNVPERGLVYNFGNDGPVVKAPTSENIARLRELDAAVEAAESGWRDLAPRLEAERAAWIKRTVGSPDLGFAAEGLTARFPLDGGLAVEGRVGVDDRDRDLRPAGASIEFQPGLFGRAAAFDGERYVEGGALGGFDYLDPFTVSLWVRPADLTGGVVSRMQDFETGSGWGLFLRDGRLRFEFTMRHTDHSMRVETRAALESDEWRHVALTYTGERPAHQGFSVYVDGEPWEFEIEWDDLKWPIGYRDVPLRIGAAAGERFRGEIDEVRLYSRALSAEDAAALAVRETLGASAAAANPSTAQRRKLEIAFLEGGLSTELRRARLDLAEARRSRSEYFDSVPTVMVMREDPAGPHSAHVLKRGAYDQPGEPVQPAPPSALTNAGDEFEPNRLGLARWLVDRSNPLTARVLVNRWWQMLFGRGLIATSEDFGSQGEPPTHPELLDWLAVEFMDSGWNVKAMLKTMVMSATYRQSSTASEELRSVDPENRLLARGPRFRLSAETVRDQALFASGLLVERRGGPSVKPYQPPGLWKEVSGAAYKRGDGEDLYRRSLYTYWKRTVSPPVMAVFDAPDRESCVVRRPRTNTPLQALALMNDVTFLEASRELGERMLREGGPTPDDRLDRGFRLTLARAPRQPELDALRRALDKFQRRFEADPDAAEAFLAQGEAPRDGSLPPTEAAAYASVASLILNLDEAVTKE